MMERDLEALPLHHLEVLLAADLESTGATETTSWSLPRLSINAFGGSMQ
jgi:hypothetical protein